MMRLILSDCLDAVRGQLPGEDAEVTGFSIDTRTLQAGDLYIAIHGERLDGHDCIAQAEAAGAAAVLVHRDVSTHLPQLRVENTRLALGRLARFWATRHQVQTVAVTGSNGKTTVKEMLAAILGQLGPVLATEGNLNNDIGVPLTLLRLRQHHRYAVIEMGANHIGEIAYLTKLALPDVAIVNNVGPSHLEGFGTLRDVADAKSEIYAGLSSDGCAIVNIDDVFASTMLKAASHCRVRTFGEATDADVRGDLADGLSINTHGRVLKPRFTLSGRHNALNALAATAAVQCLDVQLDTISSGLELMKPVAGRLERKPGVLGCTLIDDTYNANPASTRSAIDVLVGCTGNLHLVLGDMMELGEEAELLHAEVGAYAREQGVHELWTVGPLSRHASRAFGSERAFPDQATLIEALQGVLNSASTVLVKGSRSSQMERVVAALMVSANQTETPRQPARSVS